MAVQLQSKDAAVSWESARAVNRHMQGRFWGSHLHVRHGSDSRGGMRGQSTVIEFHRQGLSFWYWRSVVRVRCLN